MEWRLWFCALKAWRLGCVGGWLLSFFAVLAFVQDIRRVKADRKVSLPLFMRFVVFFLLYTSPLCWVVDAIHSERIWVYG